MLTYCFKCKNNTENVNSKVSKTKNGKSVLLSKCAICSKKKSRYERTRSKRIIK